MNKNWFTLYCDTFLWLKNCEGIAYNAKNNERVVFRLSDKVKKICSQLLKVENLYTIELIDEMISDNTVSQWINSLVYIQAGYLTYNVPFNKRPVSLRPILKVQDNKDYYEEQHKLGFSGRILQNLHELTFYINGSDSGSDEYFRQTIFPIKSDLVLNNLKILSFIKNSRSAFLSNVNLVGNLFVYPDFEKLIRDICDFSIQLTIHIMVNDFFDNMQKIKAIECLSGVRFNILVDSLFDVSFLQDLSLPFLVTALVFSDNDFIQLSSLLGVLSEDIYVRFIPLYNKNNEFFFESNIFIDKEDLSNIALSKRDIFIRQAVNVENYGKLVVMPDEMVYSNVNATALGTINNSPYTIVYKEVTEGCSWFKLRDQAPCDNCIYQWLCPSPSNYEIVFNRPNLCHIQN